MSNQIVLLIVAGIVILAVLNMSSSAKSSKGRTGSAESASQKSPIKKHLITLKH